jgi:hypothetical protein
MTYTFLADLVVVLHIVFALFVLLGGLLVLKWPRLPWLHLPAVLWGALVEFSGWFCPLTPLENWLRRLAGEAGYEGDFLQRYLLSLLYPDSLTREMQIASGTIVVALNLAVYGWLWQRRVTAPVTGHPSSDGSEGI